MSAEEEQLAILTDTGQPKVWTCPTCRGNRQMLRVLYPDEALERGVLTEICPCRTCDAAGTLDFDPDDHSVFPF